LAEYETKQRRILLDYLNAHPDRGFSVEELYDGLLSEQALEAIPGKSTIYRLIARLVQENLVKRFAVGNGARLLTRSSLRGLRFPPASEMHRVRLPLPYGSRHQRADHARGAQAERFFAG
jgi:hypothetical protein